MTDNELKSAREKYAYIPARLVSVSDDVAGDLTWKSLKLAMNVPSDWHKGGSEVRAKYSSRQLDMFHNKLLTDDDELKLMHGLLSIVFWGFVSGSRGGVTSQRALARARAILCGRKNSPPQPTEEIILHLKNVRELLWASRIGDALQAAEKIKFLKMSFASKVLTFMNPNVAAVYDAVISKRLSEQSDPILKSLYVSTRLATSQSEKVEQCRIYEKWCQWCATQAATLNVSKIKWTDWDGKQCDWRTADVERAIFALG